MMWKTFRYNNLKYCMIRMEVIWGIVILFIAGTALFWCLLNHPGEEIEKSEIHEKYEHKAQPSAESGLNDAVECYLCGSNKRSLMSYYRGMDDLGIICINQWYVMGLGICNPDGPENPDRIEGGNRTVRIGTGEGGDFFSISQDSRRGMSEVEIDYGENSIFNVDSVRDYLCQECLDKLLAVMDCYVPAGENAQARDLCMVDFQTMELYTLQEHNRSYFIRDYYVQIFMDDSGGEVNAFYMPILRD